MKLTLRLTDRDTQIGQSRALTEGRLCIGRGADNDWVLADPDRTLSKNHCRIDASSSGFMLTDLSTNGVFLVGQSQAIGRGHSCALENGDGFLLGPYVLSAEIEGGEAAVPEQGLGLPQADEEAIFPGGSGRRADGVSPIAPVIEEPWLTDIPGGAFGPGRRAAPQGWEAPPDPASYAASGVLVHDPLDPRLPGGFTSSDQFSQVSEHVAAPSTVMRLPQPQVVLPTDWNEVPVESPASWATDAGIVESGIFEPGTPEPGPLDMGEIEPAPGLAAAHPQAAAHADAAPAWPPALPTEAEAPPVPVLPPEWIAAAPEDEWTRPDPPAALPDSWVSPAEPLDFAPARAVPVQLAPAPLAPPQLAPAPLAPPPLAPLTPAPALQAVQDVDVLPAPRAPAPQRVVKSAPVAKPPAITIPAPAPAPLADAAPVSSAGAEPGADAARLVAAFLEGAGLSAGTMHGADAEASFREIGQMVRAAVDGVRDILATRALVKSEFRVDQTVLRRADNNAMKFAPDAERCLAAMVGAAPPGFLPGSAAMRQSMDDIKRHELALVAAINTVFADLGRQLNPETIMNKARQETGLGTMLPYAREIRCWTIYTETHALLQDSGAANTGGSLLAPVAQAYDRQLKRGG